MNKILIITPFYNVEKWITNTIKSVKAQTYTNFRHVLIDDLSTDSSVKIIKDLISDDDRFTLVENNEKKYALRNIYDAIDHFCSDPEEIIVTLDGDDWLASPKSLETVNDCYSQTNCLITYGSYKDFPSGYRGKFSKPMNNQIIEEKTFRDIPWITSHLRTFKNKLWKKIKIEDLLDKDQEFYKKTWDLAIMYPMLEMAGKRIKFIEKILYVYNTANDINDHKVDHSEQLKIERIIRNKERYDTINDF